VRRGELTVPITVAPEPEFTTDVYSQAAEVQTLEHAVAIAAFAPEPVGDR
jgi:hypothetical protein